MGRTQERTLSPRALNRATLARQLLLERGRLPLLPGLERVAGLQGQWNPAPFVGLWSRLEGFRREQLERALIRRRVVKATLMRSTLHLVTARDYPVFVAATHGGSATTMDPRAVAVADRVTEGARALFADGPRTSADVSAWLEREHGIDAVDRWPHVWGAIRVRGSIVHAPAAALWKMPPRMSFVALQDVAAPDPAEARVVLVRRYLAAFGPSTRADISKWSGLRIRDILPALERLEPLRRFRDLDGRELYDLPRAPLPPPDRPAPVRFLPRWDNVLLGHIDQLRVAPPEYRAVGHDGTQTFLVDGMVAGSWSVGGGRVRLEPFAPLPRGARRELEDEARRLEAFVR